MVFGINDGLKCEDICRYAPPSNKWPCADCDLRYHDRAQPPLELSEKDYADMEMLETITGYKYDWFIKDGRRVCEPIRVNNEFVKAPFKSIEDFLFVGTIEGTIDQAGEIPRA